MANFVATLSRFGMVIYMNDTYRMMTTTIKTQNRHNSAYFEVKTTRFWKVIDLSDTYRMMMIMIMMMIIMIMKTQHGYNSNIKPDYGLANIKYDTM